MTAIQLEQIYLWTDILEKYRTIPKYVHDKTFMEICRPSRFEETCSRILEFFLTPTGEHNFQELFLSSLLTLIGRQEIANHTALKDGIHVRTEERTDWTPYAKRIDIVVESINFVLAIENKINAPLYNDFDTYYKYLHTRYPDKEIICTVLSVRHLSANEKQKSQSSGFSIVYYDDLFNEVETRIESLDIDKGSKWHIILLDFIKTIRNKMNGYMAKEEEHFFFKNKSEILDLIARFDSYKRHIWVEQNESIINLQSVISIQTEIEWSIYEGTDLNVILGQELGNDGCDKKLGIESWYVENELGAKGSFQILISTWSENAWQLYKEKIYEVCKISGISLKKVDLKNNRHYLSYAYLEDGPKEEKIIESLVSAFDFLKKVFSEKWQIN